MIDLSREEMKTQSRQSSKGNQMKWQRDNQWYKADYTGYEGLAEYLVSSLLMKSTLQPKDFVIYSTQEIRYQHTHFIGCKSQNFLGDGWQMITLERLFMNTYGQSLNKSIYAIKDLKERLRFTVNQITRITGLKDFGTYLTHLLTIDALFLNEDRHTHNIAVLINPEGQYKHCPIFDNGACLLSDTSVDYPMGVEVDILMGSVKSKTFCISFDDQLDAAEDLYGRSLKFDFTLDQVEEILGFESIYSKEIKNRVLEVLRKQSSKYQYLFL